MTTPPRLGIAVCTYRRPQGLARLLAALPAGLGGLAEAPLVIIVDNDGSDPRVAAAVAASPLPARLLVEPAPGISAARNRAFAAAEAAGVTTLALIDDDEWPAPGWLAALLARRAATGAQVVGGLVEPCFPPEAAHLARWRRFWSVRPQARDGRPFVHRDEQRPGRSRGARRPAAAALRAGARTVGWRRPRVLLAALRPWA